MSFVHIRDLQPFQFNKKIKVRVCRMWRPKLIGYDDQFGGLQCILVDQMVRKSIHYSYYFSLVITASSLANN